MEIGRVKNSVNVVNICHSRESRNLYNFDNTIL
jgi:hypothetical protein